MLFQDDDLVFAHPHLGRFLQPTTVVERSKRALRDAGIREVRFHDLRHTFATQMAAAGVPLRTLQGYMGHSSYVTTEIYAGFCPDPSNWRTWAEAAFRVEGGQTTGSGWVAGSTSSSVTK